jgi:ribosomal protein S4E
MRLEQWNIITVQYQTHCCMNNIKAGILKNGDLCKVVGGTHAGKSGIVKDLHTSKSGHITITVEQNNGIRFKTLGKNVIILPLG